MKIGFTGTRKGMSEAQKDQCGMLLMAFERSTSIDVAPELHHGGAYGADLEAHQLAALDGYVIHVHPCPGVVRDFGEETNIWHEVFPPLKRNRIIVSECDILIAAPFTDREELRSGTWATIRYAREAGKPVVMLSRGKS